SVVRMFFFVVLLSIAAWALCSALRWSVKRSTDLLHDWLDATGPTLASVGGLAALLVVGGLVRGWLLDREAWKATEGDGVDTALDLYHLTREGGADDPQVRYAQPTFSLA